MYYLQSRYYDPMVGRFVNADDTTFLGIGLSLICFNVYAYCENSTINLKDAAGLYSLSLQDFKSDWVGRTILWNYLFGKGKSRTYCSSKWAAYMKKCKMCLCNKCAHRNYSRGLTLEKYINDYVRSQKKYLYPSTICGTKTVKRKLSVAVQNGEGIIGYNYLHGTKGEVGDLSLTMISCRRGGGLSVVVHCVWNDIMDPNFMYSSDSYKANIAKKFRLPNLQIMLLKFFGLNIL